MENSWHRKCGSIWQSPQGLQNQILNGSLYLHPSALVKPTSLPLHSGFIPEAVNHWSPILSSNNVGLTEPGSSFLSLLSGPSSMSPNQVLISASHASGCAARSEVSLLSSGPFPQNLASRNAEVGVDLGVCVSSKPRISANQGGNSVTHVLLQGSHRDGQQLEFPKADTHSKLSSNETLTNFSCSRLGYVDGAMASNVHKIHTGTTVGVSHRNPWKTDYSASFPPSSLSTGCPRVFCLGRSGDLLLSNYGLLGVVCSCHGVHMSVAKFSEHSGSCNVNPGNAVHVDGGETIAQWRQAYFCKYGIRIPEDHCGWEWPQWLSVTSGLLQHGPTRASLSGDSEFCNKASSFGASVHSLNQLSHILPPKNAQTVKTTGEFVHRGKHKSTQEDSSILFNGLSSSTNSSSHFLVDDHMMGSSRSVCSVMPNLIGARNLNNVCPTMSSCKGSTYVPHLHDLDALGKDVPIGRIIGSLVKDPISSNVELRLGQPSQQNQAATLESSILAVSGSHLVVHGHPRKSVFLDQHSHTTTSSRLIDETRQHNHVSGIMSSVCSRTDKTELNDMNHAHGAYMVPHASQLRLLNKNEPGFVGMSESFTNLRSLYEEKNHFESINDLINLSDAIVSKPHSGPSPAKSGQFGFPLLREKVTDTEICTNMLGNQKHEKVEEVRSTIHALRGAAKMNLGPDAKSIERMLSFVEVASDSGCTNYPVLQDKVSNVYQFPGMIPEVPNLRNTLKYCGQVSHPLHSGQHDPNSFRTISSSVELGTNLSSQAHSLGNSATNSISVKAFAASTNSENAHGRPYFLDESSKMRTTGTSKTISGQEKSQNYHGKSQVIIPPMLPGTRKTVFNFSNALNASEVATCPLVSANLTNEEDEKPPSIIDKWCNFQMPAVSKGCYSHGKDAEPPDQFHSDLERARQFFIRAGGNGNVASLSEEGSCHQELPNGCFPSKCSFSKKSDCLKGRCDLLGNPSLGEFRDNEGNAVDLVAPFFGHKLSEIYTFAEKNISSGAHSMVQNRKKSDCNAFEWRDVPRKVIEDENEADTKSSEKLVHHALKELELSNLSSGCSAPAVTQASIEANNKDSSTVDGAVADNFVVDEGSRIEICYSSDDDSEKNAEFDGFPSKLNLVDKQSSKSSVSKQSHGLFDELQFNEPLKLRKLQSQTGPNFSIQTDGNVSQNFERKSRRGKRRVVKWKRLDSSVTAAALPAAHNGALECGGDSGKLSLPLQNIPMLPQREQRSFIGSPCSVGKKLKRRSKLSSFDAVSRKRGFTPDIEVEKTDSDSNLNAKSDYSEAIKRKRLRLVGDTGGMEQNDLLNSTCIASEITAKAAAVDDKATLGKLVNVCHGRRPVVCGKYGIISNANTIKPAKIVSLSRIMKASRRCIAESTVKESKKAISNNKKELKDGIPSVVSSELNSQSSEGGKEMAYFLVSEDSQDLLHTMKKRRHDGSRSLAIPNSNINSHLRRKCKQIRKRSVNELTLKGINSSCLKATILKDGKSMLSIKSRFVSDADDGRMYADEKCNDNKHSKDSCQEHWDLGVSCCVCGSSNKDDSNCLLECNSCFIKVHQACYGVSKVPKAQWYCRPCKTSSKNIVCVLCGYGGGALTRALHTHDIVKSLLRTWGIVTESNYENLSLSEPLGKSYKMLPSTNSADESDPFLIIRPAQMEPCSVVLCNSDISEHVHTVDSPSFAPAASVLYNSITAAVFDSTIKQWVHMVCGLWTPGTCCPNVDTMSAFDVSGAHQPKHNVVCSICQRSGGTCIQCRVADCGVQFHPWCAHQKGLLQSEVEGIDSQSIGFYGRCMLHEMYQRFDLDSNHTSSADHRERESTCARTEGYKGRKREGFHDNHGHNSDAGTGCLVPQEQLNAWIHIHGQKSCARGPLKLPSSVIDYDCRKEYARYKQSRGWKHLVVYKSEIHGLGLYTSQFISRSAMVVEYVGEIVGLHVADKRETEYQAGKKLQYKSACYFFRIDKEHIIDATRKGGIARFVNHSCTPNCVAKVISVRNEKKVVFFAERDIYPGEEVTYDYHFNHEDEGKKLPCYCKSKNCRRYLN